MAESQERIELEQTKEAEKSTPKETPEGRDREPPLEGTPTDAPKAAGDKLTELFESKWEDIEKEALELLQQLLRIDTQNFMDEGTEIKAVLLLKEKFEEAGIPYVIIEPKPGRGNIVARLAGDRSSGKGAVLLSAHLDTVRAPKENWEEEGWKHNPYGGKIDEEDGCIYGRGAIDMKHMAAMSVTLLCFLKRNGIKLSRDLIFAGVADEERLGSRYGSKYLVENHAELIEADLILTEVGGFSFFLDQKEVFPVQIAEKGIVQLKITARGTGGHGSLYHKDNPIARIGEVAQKLASTRLPLRVVTANRVMIETMADFLPFPKSTAFRRLLSPRFSAFIIDHFLTEDQVSALAPTLHNVANPTVIGGGEQVNQIPSSAWLTVDCRILPECTAEDVIQDIQQVLGSHNFQPKRGPNNEELQPDLTIEIVRTRESLSQEVDEPAYMEAMDVIQKVIATRADGAPIVPVIVPGSTDAYFYAKNPRKKPVCLGFVPLRTSREFRFSKCFHGTNERIPLDGFKWGVHVLADIVCELCSVMLDS